MPAGGSFAPEDLSVLFEALRFAAEKHRDQRRKGASASPYVNHVIEVAEILWVTGGIRDRTTIVAALLHDTLEDTDATAAELENRFGAAVRRTVEEVSDDKSLPRDVRKRLQLERAVGTSRAARLIRLADKISNVADIGHQPPAAWSDRRRLDYIEWAEAVVNRIRGTNAALEVRFDAVAREARGAMAPPGAGG